MNNYETGQGYIFDTEDGEDYINVLTMDFLKYSTLK